MIDILYDHQAFKQTHGGVSRYHYDLFCYLRNLDGVRVTLTPSLSDNIYLKNDKSIKTHILPSILRRFRPYGTDFLVDNINKAISLRELSSSKYDIFHPTYYNPYFIKRLKKPFITTIHDFVHEKYRPNTIDINHKHLLLEKATKIIAISHNTKKDILEYRPDIDEHKIHVVYHGFNLLNRDAGSFHYSEPAVRPFILYVGKRTGYKNFEILLKAFKILSDELPGLDLICTGVPFNKSEQMLMKELGIEGQCRSIFASDKELSVLYTTASCFVYPSRYEGFGLPILEAFSHGCIPVLSNSSCFPEIAQNAALYFDPDNVDELVHSIKIAITDNEKRAALRELGSKRLLSFSVKQMAENTLEVYKKAI